MKIMKYMEYRCSYEGRVRRILFFGFLVTLVKFFVGYYRQPRVYPSTAY
jgi:hypothetical protein